MDTPQVTVEGKIPRSFGFNRRKLTAAATYFAMRSSMRVGYPFQSVTVILQDDVFSDEVHRGIMNIEGATDVITQRYDPMPGEPDGKLCALCRSAEGGVMIKNCCFISLMEWIILPAPMT